MSAGFDEVSYAFEMLGGGQPKFWRRLPDGTWEEYPEEDARSGVRAYAFWNAEGVEATRIVLALYRVRPSRHYSPEVHGYVIANRITHPLKTGAST